MTQEEQFGQIVALLSENSKGIFELQTTMKEMKAAKADVDTWKLEVDHHVVDLENAVNNLGDRLELLINYGVSAKKEMPLDPSTSTHWESEKVEMPDRAHLGSTPNGEASGPSGHGDDNPTTLTPPPVTGAQIKSTLTPIPFNLSGFAICDPRMHPVHHNPALPNQNFPQFDGSNPRLWVK